MQNLKYFKLLVVIFSFSLFAFSLVPTASAINVPGWPVVPCGLERPTAQEIANGKPLLDDSYYQPCGRCDLFKLTKNVIDFSIGGLMPPVSVLLFVVAGFMIVLGGANPGMYSRGKQIFSTTVWGVVIMLSAWMITNTILQSVGAKYNNAQNWWQFTCVETGSAVPPMPPENTEPGVFEITTDSLPGGVVGQSYNQVIRVVGGTVFPGSTPYAWSQDGSLPDGLSFNTIRGVISGTPAASGVSNFTIRATDNSNPPKIAAKEFSIIISPSGGNGGGDGNEDVVCLSSEINLCQPSQTDCSNSMCGQYLSSVNNHAGGAATENIIKAIMFRESSCDVNADSGTSYGLMQLTPITANIYKSRCGVTNNITGLWLTNSANADASICIAAEYIRAIAQGRCGSSVRNIAAGYNGGPTACQASEDCAGDISCSTEPVKKWECLYDDADHQVCNAGYEETRQYVPRVLYCNNNPGF